MSVLEQLAEIGKKDNNIQFANNYFAKIKDYYEKHLKGKFKLDSVDYLTIFNGYYHTNNNNQALELAKICVADKKLQQDYPELYQLALNCIKQQEAANNGQNSPSPFKKRLLDEWESKEETNAQKAEQKIQKTDNEVVISSPKATLK